MLDSKEEVRMNAQASVRDVAKVQWAVGRLHFRDELVESAMAKAITARVNQFEPPLTGGYG